MTVFQSLIKKEALHIVRDRRTLFVILFIPVLLLLLFGFAISTEVNSVRVMAVVDKHDDSTRDLLERMSTNPYFDFQGLTSAEKATGELRRGATDAVLYIRSEDGMLRSQIAVDASNPTIAQSATLYLQSLVGESAAGGERVLSTGVSKTGSPFLLHTLYNPQLKSSFNFVPGIMGMIFILICAMMTSVSIVSERETGTMDLLLVSPVRPYSIILGKLVPYLILSCGILTTILVIGYAVLGLPFSGSVVNVIWVSLLYIVLSLSIGLFVSTAVDTQLSALIVTAVMFMLPVILLSGMIYPVDNMPRVLQWVSAVVPARWYISAMRKLMVQQLELRYLLTEIAVMAGMTVVILVLAIKKFNKR